MKKIYIILTYSGTTLSKIIKHYTKDEFSHVSIALDYKLNQMYSFGRLKPYNPFCAGFVHEKINKGTFRRFYKTLTKVYSLEVNEKQYEELKNEIKNIKKIRRQYKFNIVGLFAVGLRIKIRKNNAFYCAEFVKYLLDEAKIENNLPELVRPENFKEINNIKLEYEGYLRMYKNKSVDLDKVHILSKG